ncbi:cellulase family glycosylhydrolase [Fontivita pretiosa]|uniref:cellulase family glycosylhydrolase n=1 Tax=Fontivita pretiosa TaxID=2989684 RepID=UPI003D16E805
MLESRLHLNGAPVARPAYNTGTGFFVLDGKVYDANGYEFVIKGPNNNHAWGSYVDNYNAIDHIARTGANAARVVMYRDILADPTNNWTDAADTVARRKETVERYLANGIVPVVEDHASIQDSSSQSNTAALHEIVTHWLENASWLKQYESAVILNIANEWGPPANASGSNTTWREAYKTQVLRLRAGPDGNLASEADNINCLIMIDAGQWGQDFNTLRLHARDILSTDPQHNIVFSIHLYGQWRADDRPFETFPGTDYGPWDVFTSLNELVNPSGPGVEPLALVVGEWAWEDFRDFSNLSAPYAAYRTRRIMEICNQLGIGWLGWSWNHSSPTTLNMIAGAIQNYQYNSNENLTEWGNWLVNDPDFGTRATAKRATVFPIAGLPNPTTPGLSPLPAQPPTDLRLVLQSTTVHIPEGGQGAAYVKLNKQPPSNITINVARIFGGSNDLDINPAAGSTSLTFTPANFGQFQSILFNATVDADATQGTAKFQLSGGGLLAADFIAKEIEPPTASSPIVINPDRDRLYNGSGTATSVTVSSTFPPVGAPNGTFFMRFNLAGVTGKIASATLRVFTTNTTANRFVRVFHTISDTWSETATSGINASYPIVPNPAAPGNNPGILLPTTGGSYLEISYSELTRLIRAEHLKDGIVSLALRMVSGTAVFFTDESANRPELVVTTAEAIPPRLLSASFDYATSPNRLRFTFDEDVSASLSSADVVVESISNPGTVLTLSTTPDWNPATNTASFTISPGIVPDGNYRVTLLASGVSDAAGNAMLAGASLDFFALAGDANHDRVVNSRDLLALASNWQQSPRGFADGDFNYDGTVDAADLQILTGNWQQSLPAPAPPPAWPGIATAGGSVRLPAAHSGPFASATQSIKLTDLQTDPLLL